MFLAGTILHFPTFYFRNIGAEPTNKYFLVIKNIGDSAILISLPSSQKHLPDALKNTYGCMNVADSGIGCYAFKARHVIATNGFYFGKDTYLYGAHLDEYEIENIVQRYPFPNIDYTIVGTLIEDLLESIIDCFKSSPAVKNKYKRML